MLKMNFIPSSVPVQVLQRPTGEQKQQLAACSKRVAGAVTELIQSAEAMKGNGSHTPHHSYCSMS